MYPLVCNSHSLGLLLITVVENPFYSNSILTQSVPNKYLRICFALIFSVLRKENWPVIAMPAIRTELLVLVIFLAALCYSNAFLAHSTTRHAAPHAPLSHIRKWHRLHTTCGGIQLSNVASTEPTDVIKRPILWSKILLASVLKRLSLFAVAFVALIFSSSKAACAAIEGWDLYGRVPNDDWLFSNWRLTDPCLLKRSLTETVK
jgi:hypothetical protein